MISKADAIIPIPKDENNISLTLKVNKELNSLLIHINGFRYNFGSSSYKELVYLQV